MLLEADLKNRTREPQLFYSLSFRKKQTFAIVANPASGSLSFNKKFRILKKASRILKAPIYGLDTTCRKEFRECIKAASEKHDVIVAAGGDGTFSDAINSIDLERNAIGYLPLGRGNAIRYALKYPSDPLMCAHKIRYGRIERVDLIRCNRIGYFFMGSVGIEAEVLKQKGKSYVLKTLSALKKIQNFSLSATLFLNGRKIHCKNAASIVFAKQPFYGYGMKIIPQAGFKDGLIHIGVFPSGFLKLLLMIVLSFSAGNFMGQHYTCKDEAFLRLEKKQAVQVDGDVALSCKKLHFRLKRGILKVVV